jgi:hypothetical protein
VKSPPIAGRFGAQPHPIDYEPKKHSLIAKGDARTEMERLTATALAGKTVTITVGRTQISAVCGKCARAWSSPRSRDIASRR